MVTKQFGGRASMVANFVGGSSTDGNGHGTAIAGVVGGLTYGVSRNTALLGVKVLDDSGSGTTSGIISAIDWIASDVFTRNCPKGFVVNIAFGGSFSTALNTAVATLISGGTFVSVFAGGNAANVANYSPASVLTACTVGGSTSTDTAASWSNYGSLLDIWAPGQSVVTTGLGGTTVHLPLFLFQLNVVWNTNILIIDYGFWIHCLCPHCRLGGLYRKSRRDNRSWDL